jgi:hypothetical protein
MSFQWLDMRITEEKERRERDAVVQERLPRALGELYAELEQCVEVYRLAFGADSAEIRRNGAGIQVTVRDQRTGQWQECAHVQIQTVPTLPGFRIENGKEPEHLEVGTLPGDKLLFKYQSQYLTLEQVTRLILDPAFFPDLDR